MFIFTWIGKFKVYADDIIIRYQTLGRTRSVNIEDIAFAKIKVGGSDNPNQNNDYIPYVRLELHQKDNKKISYINIKVFGFDDLEDLYTLLRNHDISISS